MAVAVNSNDAGHRVAVLRTQGAGSRQPVQNRAPFIINDAEARSAARHRATLCDGGQAE